MGDPRNNETDDVGNLALVTVGDPVHAEQVGSRHFYPQQLKVLGDTHEFAMSMRFATLGAISLADLTYAEDVSIDCGELETSYHVNVPLRGRLSSRHAGKELIATPEFGAVYGPEGETVLSRWEADCRQLCVKIDRSALENHLSGLVRHDQKGALKLDSSIDVRTGVGRSWVRLAQFLLQEAQVGGSLARTPLVAASMEDALLRGLLASVGQRYLDEAPASRSQSVPHHAVRAAVEFIEDHPADAITTSEIARHCNLSLRAVQDGFARYLGVSPLQYLRHVRLHRAHLDLLAADPFETTVSTIAHRWGFTHLGRFAAAHTAEFSEAPSVSLRRS